MPKATRFFIWSTERQMWWKPRSMGYSDDLYEAGRYTSESAIAIVMNAMEGWDGKGIPPELMIPADFEKPKPDTDLGTWRWQTYPKGL